MTTLHIAEETKTNELVETLLEALSSKSAFSEFEIAYYKREAERLPDASHTHVVLSLLYAVQGQPKQTAVHGLEAVRLSGNPAIIGNAILALAMVGASRSLYDLLRKVDPTTLTKPVIANYVNASFLLYAPELTSRALYLLADDESYHEHIVNFEIKNERVNFAVQNYGLNQEDIEKASMLAAETLEESPEAIGTELFVYLLPEDKKCLVSVEVACEPEAIFDLNWNLSLKIAETDLLNRPLVVRFDSSKRAPGIRGLV